MSDSTKAFKVITGEEIIARVVEIHKDFYLLKSIRTITMIPNNNGSVGIALLPFVTACGADGTFKLSVSAIIGEAEKIDTNLEKVYLQQTTGIQLV